MLVEEQFLEHGGVFAGDEPGLQHGADPGTDGAMVGLPVVGEEVADLLLDRIGQVVLGREGGGGAPRAEDEHVEEARLDGD